VVAQERPRDQRYADLAPGTVPFPGEEVRVVPGDPNIPIPVAFSPPPIPVAEAGLLIDGQVDSTGDSCDDPSTWRSRAPSRSKALAKATFGSS
jgi:hypothetical protein